MSENEEELVLYPGLKQNTGNTSSGSLTSDEIKTIVKKKAIENSVINRKPELLENLAIIKNEADVILSKLSDIKNNIILSNNEIGSSPNDDCIEYIQLRNLTIMEYVLYLTKYYKQKCLPDEDDQINVITNHLMKNNLILEKIKTYERGLAYKFQKFESELTNESALSLRANPSAMLGDDYMDDGEMRMVSGEYVPTKISSKLYPKAHKEAVGEAKYARKIKARTKSDALIDEVAADLDEDNPLLRSQSSSNTREIKEFLKRQMDIEKFEEENFVRVQSSKKERAMLKRIRQMQTSFESVLDYGKIRSDEQRKKDILEKKKRREEKGLPPN